MFAGRSAPSLMWRSGELRALARRNLARRVSKWSRLASSEIAGVYCPLALVGPALGVWKKAAVSAGRNAAMAAAMAALARGAQSGTDLPVKLFRGGSRRRRDPALEIGQRAFAERALRARFLPSRGRLRPSAWRRGKRRKQAEIDVHRLERTGRRRWSRCARR